MSMPKTRIEIEVSQRRDRCPVSGCESRPYIARPVCANHKRYLSLSDRTLLYYGSLSVEEAVRIIERKERLAKDAAEIIEGNVA